MRITLSFGGYIEKMCQMRYYNGAEVVSATHPPQKRISRSRRTRDKPYMIDNKSDGQPPFEPDQYILAEQKHNIASHGISNI